LGALTRLLSLLSLLSLPRLLTLTGLLPLLSFARLLTLSGLLPLLALARLGAFTRLRLPWARLLARLLPALATRLRPRLLLTLTLTGTRSRLLLLTRTSLLFLLAIASLLLRSLTARLLLSLASLTLALICPRALASLRGRASRSRLSLRRLAALTRPRRILRQLIPCRRGTRARRITATRPSHLALQLLRQRIQFIPRPPQCFGLIAQHALGSLLHPFAQLGNASTGLAFRLARLLHESALQQLLPRVQRLVRLLLPRLANRIV
jgi:hypothetical protein